ncbi:hypothetical protein [Helicobacter sp. 23-1045]
MIWMVASLRSQILRIASPLPLARTRNDENICDSCLICGLLRFGVAESRNDEKGIRGLLYANLRFASQ